MHYVLITPAYNEIKYIEYTLKAVIAQTQRPLLWLIVSDGSDDGTDDLVQAYADKQSFIQLIRKERQSRGHDYAAKVKAIEFALDILTNKNLNYDYLGMLDADIRFKPDYYAKMQQYFSADPKLGIAGGLLYEHDAKGNWGAQVLSPDWSVSGPVQLFRRTCFEQIGGYLPLKNGEDAMAEVMARMHGYRVQTFVDVAVEHLRPTYSQKGNALSSRYWEGQMDYINGNHLLFELARSIFRLREFPWGFSSIFLFTGYCMAWITGVKIAIPTPVRVYLQQEQKQRLKHFFTTKTIRRWWS